MSYAKISDYDRGVVLGCFKTDSGAMFEYCERTEEAGDWAADFPHLPQKLTPSRGRRGCPSLVANSGNQNGEPHNERSYGIFNRI